MSYSHADRRWLKRLQMHMRPLVRDAEVKLWDDTMIKAGADWRSEIEHALASAKVAVLLVSPAFLASDFITNDELPKLLRAAKDEGAIILSLILSPSRFERIPSLARFQAINPPDRPLAKLKGWQQDELLAKAADDIENALAAPPQGSQKPRRAAARPAEASPRTSKSAERRKEPKAPRAKTHAATPRPKQTSPTKGEKARRSKKPAASPRPKQTATAEGKPTLSAPPADIFADFARGLRRNIEGELRAAGISGVSPELASSLAKQLVADEKILAGSAYEQARLDEFLPPLSPFRGGVHAGDLITTDKRLLLFPRGMNLVVEVQWSDLVGIVPWTSGVPGTGVLVLPRMPLGSPQKAGALRGTPVGDPRQPCILYFHPARQDWAHIVIHGAERADMLMHVVNTQIRAAEEAKGIAPPVLKFPPWSSDVSDR